MDINVNLENDYKLFISNNDLLVKKYNEDEIKSKIELLIEYGYLYDYFLNNFKNPLIKSEINTYQVFKINRTDLLFLLTEIEYINSKNFGYSNFRKIFDLELEKLDNKKSFLLYLFLESFGVFVGLYIILSIILLYFSKYLILNNIIILFFFITSYLFIIKNRINERYENVLILKSLDRIPQIWVSKKLTFQLYLFILGLITIYSFILSINFWIIPIIFLGILCIILNINIKRRLSSSFWKNAGLFRVEKIYEDRFK